VGNRWRQVELFTITLPVTNWLRGPATTDGQKGPIPANPTDQQIKECRNPRAGDRERKSIAKVKNRGRILRAWWKITIPGMSFGQSGGSRGLINKGSMLDTKLEDYVFSLPRRKPSAIPFCHTRRIFGDSTMKVVRVGIKKEARTIPFEEAQAQLLRRFRQQQLQDLPKPGEWLNWRRRAIRRPSGIRHAAGCGGGRRRDPTCARCR